MLFKTDAKSCKKIWFVWYVLLDGNKFNVNAFRQVIAVTVSALLLNDGVS